MRGDVEGAQGVESPRAARTARRAAAPRLAALAVALVAVASGLAFVPGGDAHFPASPGEAAGNPTGLAGITFRGPIGTSIETSVCPPILDAERPIYGNPGNMHIGHVNGINAPGPSTTNYIEPGTVDLWHFEDDGPSQYSNPNAIEGPHSPTSTVNSIMMGPDGFMRGRMHQTVYNQPGFDLTITDVHARRSYCVYGAIQHGGPYLFIHATWGDAFVGTQSPLDLAWFYATLFAYEYPNATVRMDYVFLVASAYNDPPFPSPPTVTVDFECTSLDPSGMYDLAPGVRFVATANVSDGTWPTYTWAFGDGESGTGRDVTHIYADDDAYLVTLTVTTPTGGTATASKVCNVLNRPPVANFVCPRPSDDGSMVFSALHSRDPEGPVTVVWDFGDSSLPQTGDVIVHFYDAPGTYNVRLTVYDNDKESTKATRAVTEDVDERPCIVPPGPNHPPLLEPVPRQYIPIGALVEFQVHGSDPDGDEPLAYYAPVLPPGSSFDPDTRTFRWRPPETGLYTDLRFRVVDPGGLFDEKLGLILVYDRMTDADMDGVPDVTDNCPAVPNHAQLDRDNDGVGDACSEGRDPFATDAEPLKAMRSFERDQDEDGIADVADICPHVPDASQSDLDGDGRGDACDPDIDDDGFFQAPLEGAADNCPTVPNPDQADRDGDGRGDACTVEAATQPGNAGKVEARGGATQARLGVWTQLQILALGLLSVLVATVAIVGWTKTRRRAKR